MVLVSRKGGPMVDTGWLKRQFDDTEALQRAQQKLVRAYDRARRNGYTQPMSIEFTMPELRAIASVARVCFVSEKCG